jgi:hypothetical protein
VGRITDPLTLEAIVIAQSIQPTIAEAVIAAMVAALKTVPGGALLTTPTVHLFTAVTGLITPTIATTAFTEASFAGYAAITPTLAGPLNLSSNNGLAEGLTGSFVASSSITSPGQNVLGYWVDNGSTTFYAAELFPTPITFVNPYDFLELTVLFGAIYKPMTG